MRVGRGEKGGYERKKKENHVDLYMYTGIVDEDGFVRFRKWRWHSAVGTMWIAFAMIIGGGWGGGHSYRRLERTLIAVFAKAR